MGALHTLHQGHTGTKALSCYQHMREMRENLIFLWEAALTKLHAWCLWPVPLAPMVVFDPNPATKGEYLHGANAARNSYAGFTRNGFASTPSQNAPFGEQTLGCRTCVNIPLRRVMCSP